MIKYKNVISNGLRSYIKHIHVVIGYAIALFVVMFVQNSAFAIVNGNVEFVYAKGYSIYVYLLVLLGLMVSSLVYAMFSSILVFVVKRDLFQGVSKINIVKFIINSAKKVFVVFFVADVLMFLIYLLMVNTIISFILPLIYFVMYFFIFYFTQTIVIDDEGVVAGLLHDLKFMKKHKLTNVVLFVSFFVLVVLVHKKMKLGFLVFAQIGILAFV